MYLLGTDKQNLNLAFKSIIIQLDNVRLTWQYDLKALPQFHSQHMNGNIYARKLTEYLSISYCKDITVHLCVRITVLARKINTKNFRFQQTTKLCKVP